MGEANSRESYRERERALERAGAPIGRVYERTGRLLSGGCMRGEGAPVGRPMSGAGLSLSSQRSSLVPEAPCRPLGGSLVVPLARPWQPSRPSLLAPTASSTVPPSPSFPCVSMDGRSCSDCHPWPAQPAPLPSSPNPPLCLCSRVRAFVRSCVRAFVRSHSLSGRLDVDGPRALVADPAVHRPRLPGDRRAHAARDQVSPPGLPVSTHAHSNQRAHTFHHQSHRAHAQVAYVHRRHPTLAVPTALLEATVASEHGLDTQRAAAGIADGNALAWLALPAMRALERPGMLLRVDAADPCVLGTSTRRGRRRPVRLEGAHTGG